MYSFIVRVCYCCKHEAGCLLEEQNLFEKALMRVYNRKIFVKAYEKVLHFAELTQTRKNCYIKRNHLMINNSEFCIFYCKNDLQQNKVSAAKLALTYAKKKDKKIIMC